jgi:hypothetical protein
MTGSPYSPMSTLPRSRAKRQKLRLYRNARIRGTLSPFQLIPDAEPDSPARALHGIARQRGDLGTVPAEMWNSSNGTSTQFWCRAEKRTFDAADLSAITRIIYAPAWQESCGLRDVLLRRLKTRGLQIDNGYGGSVGVSLKAAQFFPSNGANTGVRCIQIDIPYVTGCFHLVLDEVSFGSAIGFPDIPTLK